MKRTVKFRWLLSFCAVFCWVYTAAAMLPPAPGPHTIIVMFDGLRPDYISPQLMPRLYEMSKSGAYGASHHSVYPTVTRVNAASYATGSYPQLHGIMENSLYLPTVDSTKTLSTGNVGQLRQIDAKLNGQLLTAPSLGELLEARGEQLFVYSSGTTGQAYLQNHKEKGAIINPDVILPETFRQKVLHELGSPPEETTPNSARHKWVADALIKYSLIKSGPLVSAIWFSDPDHTAHEHGIGSALTREALKVVDTEFGRILDSIHSRGLESFFNIVISADHGFISYGKAPKIVDFLVEKGLKKTKASTDVVIAGSSIYVKDRNTSRIKKIVEALQQQDWVGAIFTKAATPGSYKGHVPGTFSFDIIRWNHASRVGDIVVSENWNDAVNDEGVPGIASANGAAGHGGASKYEMHIALIAFGPSFKPFFTSELPSSNIDIVPTILALYQIPYPTIIQGRVLNELLVTPVTQKKESLIENKTLRVSAKQKNGVYTEEINLTTYDGYTYINYVKASRTKK